MIECLILEAISNHLKNKEVIRISQYGFTKCKSHLTLFPPKMKQLWWMKEEQRILFSLTSAALLTLSQYPDWPTQEVWTG